MNALKFKDNKNKHARAQVAVDFLVSYGIVILIIAIAIYVVLRLGVFNVSLAPATCSAVSSFICSAASLSKNGIATFVLTQALGGSIILQGAACDSNLNATGQGPLYGNTKMQTYSVASQFYPNSNLANPGVTVYSGASYVLTVYCYGVTGVAGGNLGQGFAGYLWLNYTYSGLPSTYHNVQRVVQFNTYYT